MGLKKYWQKRDFKKTPEPHGELKKTKHGFSFVIQKHAASHLHYDFRLELDGVLLSWAVPKGPSLDPQDKRLAMHVEDHPIDYGGFEGIIPKGEYGGGTVLLWDRGNWIPDGDPREGYRKGRLKFKLEGEKLRGGWTLVRMHFRKSSKAQNDDEPNKEWLLIKERDDEAKSGAKAQITETAPLSVLTGADLQTISKSKNVWNSNRKEKKRVKIPDRATKEPLLTEEYTATLQQKKLLRRDVEKIKRTILPEFIRPQLATLVSEAPKGDNWVHEVKFDGYRLLARKDGNGSIRFFTRNANDWTDRFSQFQKPLNKIKAKSFWLDGEVVVVNPEGRSEFQLLQNALSTGGAMQMRFYIFDIFFLDGEDLRELPLLERKAILRDLIQTSPSENVIYFSDHITGEGNNFFNEACSLKLEGIISKRADAPYQPGRGSSWLKTKCVHEEEFVIAGYSEPKGGRANFGALLVGFYKKGEKLLEYAGKVGTGFDGELLKSLGKKLKSLHVEKSFFKTPPRGKDIHWVKPELVAQFRYTEKTQDGRLRHPAFLGLREDKPAREVHEEKARKISEVIDQQEVNQLKNEKKKKKTSEKAAEKRVLEQVGEKKKPSLKNLPRKETRRVTGQVMGIKITHPDRILFPAEGITKLEVATFYEEISPWIMPHLTGRPVMIVRCPEGSAKQCFFQKHATDSIPKEVGRVSIAEKNGGGKSDYLMLDQPKGLISLVQMGALEFHVWGSRKPKIECPDQMIFDLDPDPKLPWKSVVEAAKQIRETLEKIKLRSFLKTSGGKGLHIVVPLNPIHPWDVVKDFSRMVVDALATAEPKLYTADLLKSKRNKKIFVDYLRNGRGATCVVAYSTRARPGAAVSTPIEWEELDEGVRSDQFNVSNLMKRLRSLKKDPWEGIAKVRQSLPRSIS